MAGVNKVILVGNCGRDPESRHTKSGITVVNLSLATSRRIRDRQTGEMRDQTEWHRVVFFDKKAEIAAQYLRKGSKVYIEGSLRTREREQDGIKRYTTEVVATDMQFLDSASGSGGAAPARQSRADDWGQQGRDSKTENAPAQETSANNAGASLKAMDFDDDIPF